MTLEDEIENTHLESLASIERQQNAPLSTRQEREEILGDLMPIVAQIKRKRLVKNLTQDFGVPKKDWDSNFEMALACYASTRFGMIIDERIAFLDKQCYDCVADRKLVERYISLLVFI